MIVFFWVKGEKKRKKRGRTERRRLLGRTEEYEMKD
jgi:hypothetical protein